MKHRSLIKDRVRINFIPPTKNCFYIKTFPLTQIFQSVDLKEWTVLNWTLGFFPYSYLSSLSTSEYNNNTVNISFTTLLFGVNVPYRTRGIIMSHEISCDAAPGCLLVFRPLSGRGWLIGRILRQGHLLEIPENVQSIVEESQMQKQLIIIKKW